MKENGVIHKLELGLWERYKISKDTGTRNEIFIAYEPVIEWVIKKQFHRLKYYRDIEDIISCCNLVLLNAIDRYDHTKNIKFETFAFKSIVGAVKDYFRHQDIHSYPTRSKIKECESAEERLMQTLGCLPSDGEVANAMKISLNRYHELKLLKDTLLCSEDCNVFTVDSEFERFETKHVLESAMKDLSERERQVIRLYYLEDMKMADIAVIIGVKMPRVSQIIKTSLEKIKQSPVWGEDGGENEICG